MARSEGGRELRVHGFNAAEAVWKRRPADVLRVFVAEERVGRLGGLLKDCARRRRPYRIVGHDELERLAESVHHEGVVVVARERPQPAFEDVLARTADAPDAVLLWLDGVANPHNLGALLRVSAHFGVAAILGSERLARLSPSACRVAEGGAEVVDLVAAPPSADAFAALRARGFRIVGTDGRAGRSLYGRPLPRRTVLVVGNEVAGMSDAVRADLDEVVRIPGTGAVESLNVGNAAAVVLGEAWRQAHARR